MNEAAPEAGLSHDYCLTPITRHPNTKNTFLFTKSVSRILTFHMVEDLLTQPVLVVAGGEAGSLSMSTELHGRARTTKKVGRLKHHPSAMCEDFVASLFLSVGVQCP
ncbi:hypothetical protein ACGFU4_33400 [Streptomyces sp. NPDC048511]|uniref:hypothetical protein n=1 Tax=Streptomyces sp. NPDC048511 TaxID=3365562 RepID=UPI0037146184